MGAEIKPDSAKDTGEQAPAGLSFTRAAEAASPDAQNEPRVVVQEEETGSKAKLLVLAIASERPADGSAKSQVTDNRGGTDSKKISEQIEQALLKEDSSGHKRIAISMDTLKTLAPESSREEQLSFLKTGIIQALARSTNLKEVVLLNSADTAKPDDISTTKALSDFFANTGKEVAEQREVLEKAASKEKALRLLQGIGTVEELSITGQERKYTPLRDLLKIEGTRTGEIAERAKPSPEQVWLAQHYQKNVLLPVLEAITPHPEPKEGQDTLSAQSEYKALIEKKDKAIREELSQGVWGPESQSAFASFLEKLKANYPKRIAEMESLGLRITRNNPVDMPVENGQRISEQEFLRRINSGEIGLDLKLDPEKIPSVSEFKKIGHISNWLADSSERIRQAEEERTDQRLTQFIKERQLPEGWLYKDGQDKAAWRASVIRMIDITMNVGRKINLIENLKTQGSFFSKFPMEYPPGTVVSKGKDGRPNIKLELPDSPDLLSEKTKRLLNWDEEAEPKVKSAVKQYEDGRANPVAAIAFGDTAVPKFKDKSTGQEISAHAIFDTSKDKDGKLIETLVGFGNPSTMKLKEGQTSRPFNLLEQRPSIEHKDGKIIVTQSAQAQQVPWYSYQNMIWENVGGPAKLTPQDFKPDDIVAIKSGHSTDYMLASDLERYIAQQQVLHYGEKALMATMDVAMFSMGAVQISAAVRGARLLAAGAAVAGDITARQVVGYGAKGSLEAVLGLTGPASNAYWTSTESGRLANGLRAAAFVTMALPTSYEVLAKDAPAAMRALMTKAGLRSPSELEGAEKAVSGLQRLIHESGPAIEGTAKWAGRALAGSQFPMIPLVGEGLILQTKELLSQTDPEALQAIVNDAKNAKANAELTRAKLPQSELSSALAPERAIELAESLKSSFINGLRSARLPSQTIAESEKIFEKLKKALSPAASAEERNAIVKNLLANVTIGATDIQNLEKRNQGQLTGEELSRLNVFAGGQAKREDLLKQYVEKSFERRDQNIMAASELALLFLAKQTGMKPDATYEITVAVPSNRINSVKYGLTTLPEHNATLKLTPDAISSNLAKRMELLAQDGRGIAVGDVLLRMGKYSGAEYGKILSQVILNPGSSTQEKLAALTDKQSPRIAAVYLSSQLREIQLLSKAGDARQREVLVAATFGRTSADLSYQLRQTAETEANPKVRSIAAAMVYGLELMKGSPADGAKFLDRVTALSEQAQREEKVELVAEMKKLLLSELSTSSPQESNRRISLVYALQNLSSALPDSQKQAIENVSTNALVESLLYADLPSAVELLKSLTPERMKTLAQTEPELRDAVISRSLQLMQVPPNRFDAAKEKQLIALANKLPELLPYAPEAHKSYMFMSNLNMAKRTPQIYPNLRAELIANISKYGDKALSAVDYMRSLAEGDPNALLREAAINSLDRMNAPDFAELLAQRLHKEQDINLLGVLQDLARRRGEKTFYEDSTRDLLSFQSDFNKRYPIIKDFDGAKQKEWLQKNFPLLDRETFLNQLKEGSKDKLGNHIFDTPQSFGDGLAEQREQQFKELAEFAKRDGDAEAVQKARMILYSIIASNGKSIGGDSQLITLGTVRNGRAYSTVKYQETRADWSLLAARALAKTSDTANSGRDLSARLLAMALSSSVGGQTKETLLRAWKELDKEGGTKRPVPLSVYLYVLSQAEKK